MPEPTPEHVPIPLCLTITDRALDLDEEHFTSEVTLLRTLLQPNLKCDLCSIAGHDKYSCDYLLRCLLVAEHVKKDPQIKDRIFD